jgi:hypothetical protein
MRRTVLLVALSWCACSGKSSSSDPIDLLYGEVHIHQFEGGSHLGALFVRTPVPAASVPADEILPTTPPSQTAGGCTLTNIDPTSLPPTPAQVDAGVVHLRGDRDVDLAWMASLAGYEPTTPLPLGSNVFGSGVTVRISSDGGAVPGFSGSVVTPAPLQLLSPQALFVGDKGDFTVTWVPSNAERVTIDLVVSRSDGASAIIDCRADDATGSFAIPRALLDAVPARPRDLQLEVSRDQILSAPSRRAGQGVLLHAGFEAELAGHEP